MTTILGYDIVHIDFHGSLPQCIHHMFFKNIAYDDFFKAIRHTLDIETIDSVDWLDHVNECILIFNETSNTIQIFGDPVRKVGTIHFQTYFDCSVIQLKPLDLQFLLFSTTGYRKVTCCVITLLVFILGLCTTAVLYYTSM